MLGGVELSLMPELEALALDERYLNFSHHDQIGGGWSLMGTQWSIAGLVAQTAGVPLRTASYIPEGEHGLAGALTQAKMAYFMPGVYSLGEVLQKAGYHNALRKGGTAEFGGTDRYFSEHGHYTLHDFDSTRAQKWLAWDYKIDWWGYEDRKLYEFAKIDLQELSQTPPFHYVLITVDTHFQDGWLDPACPKIYRNQYDNVHRCASLMFADFFNWLREQPWFEDTVIIVSADHIGPQTPYYLAHTKGRPYQRSMYNLWVNARVTPVQNKRRYFTALDMYPSTLAALGATIEGERLGLGVNLFSQEKTLLELFHGDINALDAEILKRNDLYDKKLRNIPYDVVR